MVSFISGDVLENSKYTQQRDVFESSTERSSEPSAGRVPPKLADSERSHSHYMNY